MRESMQCAHAIAEVRNESTRLDHLADARREIIHRRVDEGHDEHILIGGNCAVGNKLRGKRRKREGLSRPGHCRDAKLAAAIAEDVCLGGAEGEGGKGHGIICIVLPSSAVG